MQGIERPLWGSFLDASFWSFPVIGFDEISATLLTFQGMVEWLVWRTNCGAATRLRVEKSSSRIPLTRGDGL